MLFAKLDGDSWSARAARAGFPILVEYVREGNRNITYGQWDAEIVKRGLGKHVFLTQYGRPAGMIGDACAQYAENAGIAVPPINLMVVNKSNNLPGHGANYYIQQFCRTKIGREVDADKLTAGQKRTIIDQAQDEILAFRDWEKVLKAYGLTQSEAGKVIASGNKKKRRHPDPEGWHRGPESEAHKALKQRIIDNPRLVGLKRNAEGELERRLWSGDRLDVYFAEADLAVEVKAVEAGFDELHRGIFQCVKYKAVLRAQKIHDRQVPAGDSVLAIGGHLPSALREVAALFDVTVFENLMP
ncbi:hypothetical protein J3P71_06205 [Rhizobium leguminosarum]|uniref:hypothetical protein n=1 Tax=Rhizobium leguminosarum TaxID=384 RepID=UPI0014427245|nr:hypothetical protein [Rhizobium leguminosarum]MBY5836860.1 hypothetical protein [Rhizobium leguminosarum]NKM81919.1 hypothetical protein [Rhizobium leguminosarum bv. viciae]QSZ09363.1 hypothetical protein J3P71_06205 [Rhizobium leguminosarum]